MRFTLRTKFMLLIAGTVLALTAVMLAAMMAVTGREIERAARNDVRSAGGVLAQLIREREASLERQCGVAARQPMLKALLQAGGPGSARPDGATVSDSVRELLADLGADSAFLLDRDGRLMGSTDGLSAAGADEGVRAAMAGRAWRGIVWRGERLMLAVSVPVTIHREVWGVLTAHSTIDGRMAEELKGSLGIDVLFVHEGTAVGSSLPASAGFSVSFSRRAAETAIHGRRYLSLYETLPTSNPALKAGFVVLRPYEQAMELYGRFRTALISVSLVVLALALAVAAAVARGITRPLDSVVHAANTLRAGEWPERIEVKRTDEIGLLQSAFNSMTASVRASQERLLALIDTDPLTELDNHRRFQERLAREADRAAASGGRLSLVLLNIDRFKEFNRAHGHAAGDQALVQFARVAREFMPEEAAAARYGGDVFAVLLPGKTLAEAEALAEQIRELAAETMPHHDISRLTLSGGCAELGPAAPRGESLALAAELAMAQAKQLGRGRVMAFNATAAVEEGTDPQTLYRFLKDGSLATIQALAAAVDAKDPYTQGHSQRVAKMASALARKIGLPTEEVEMIYITGTLHDVGKIGVPDAVLQKPDRLTPDERAVIETHPVLGEVIVRKAPQLAGTLPGVRHHHERWDGLGYPDRLSGESIPLAARILALADTFDAITSDRPYRRGLAADAALAEIARGAGRQFDPKLAKAFLEMASESDGAEGARGLSAAAS
jgi:diguanylate cyclase (GGDEF)-like protein